MNEHVFALDIGTQSVTGILLKKMNDKSFKVIDFCVKHHNERSMLDGQIQDVIQVAEVITEVKHSLEKTYGPLEKVCVAAAGRALKTIRTEKTISIKDTPITTDDEVKYLELSAVQKAQVLLSEENKHHFTNYHCVGFSVLHYYLDGEKIGSLIDQIGNEAKVEIIATFLPKVVVESLLAALSRANLTMDALTLEPIAAIHVLIPESMRRLNVALIDIGAGTSDIAISNDGTVVAYGMVPTAGDEITEAISDHYLLDFKEAEKVKQKIVNEKSATIHDILGFETTVTYDEVLPHLNDSIDRLAKLLAEEVVTLNSKAPQAVMLIGGGSLTPQLGEKLAAYLQLPVNRVAIRGIDAIHYLEQSDNLPSGPDFVTPVGIAISATKNPLHYISVTVNDKVTLMFETKQLTVGDCLVQAGIEVNKYYGKIGLASIIKVNGEDITLRGDYGKPPTIYVNNELATVDSVITSGDQITIHKGKDGTNPSVTIEDIVGNTEHMRVTLNGEIYHLHATYLANHQVVDKHYIVKDKDNIIVQMPETVGDFLRLHAKDFLNGVQHFFVTINERQVKLHKGNATILVNGKNSSLTTFLQNNDDITIKHPEMVTVKTLLDQLEKQSTYQIKVTFNNQPVVLTQQLLSVTRNDLALQLDDELHDGDQLTLVEEKQRPFIFQDVFRYVDVDISPNKGTYKLYRNDEITTFHDEIIHGDQLKIVWE